MDQQVVPWPLCDSTRYFSLSTHQPPDLENVRIDPQTGDGVCFTLEIEQVSHRFFVSRSTLSDLERTLLASNHDMVASFVRQTPRIIQAAHQTAKLGTSHHITFLQPNFFE